MTPAMLRPQRKGLAWLAAALLLSCPMPALAAAPQPGAEIFGAAPAIDSVALSPDGALVAWAETGGASQQVVVVDIATGRILRRSPVPDDLKLRWIDWADDDTLLIDVSTTHVARGNAFNLYEFFRTIALDLPTGRSRVLLMADEARSWGTAAVMVATRTTAPDTVVMASWNYSATAARQSTGTRLWEGRRDSGWTYDVFAVDVRTGQGRRLAAGTGFTVDWLADPGGKPVARADWDPSGPLFTVHARRDGGGWREVYRLTNGSTLMLAGLTADGNAITALGSDGSGRSRLWAIATDGSGATGLVEDAERDVVAVYRDPYTQLPVGAWLGGAAPEIRWIDAAAERRFTQVARAFPDRTVELFGRSADGQRILARVGGPSAPPVYYLVDFASRQASIVGEAYPGLTDVPLGVVEATSYEARDGTRIPAYVTLPPGSSGKGLPLVVLPHGGPEARDYYDFDWFAQFLATRGYAVLQPQFRGSTGFGDAFRQAGHGEWGGLMQDDVTDGVQALVDQGIADPKRVCIVGGGYGGYAALAGVTLTPELYACAVSINGVSDLPMVVGNAKIRSGEDSNSYAYWSKIIGSVHDSRLAERSPARLAAAVRAPVLLLHGSEDTVVPIDQSRAMARALAQADKPHEFIELPGEDHWLSRSATRIRVLEETGRFLARHLGAP